MIAATPLDWLMQWYEDQCEFGAEDPVVGGWEHHYGITIGTIDNPGWSLVIDLKNTALDGQSFSRRERKYGHETEWWTYYTENNQFNGAGGPRQLGAMIEVFRTWATKDC